MIMNEKILVADDSSTIQKVIQITLASMSYTLTQCLDEADLLKKIKKDSFSLILLDFNLSENKSGYELAKEIAKIAPNTPIMIMLGTFDSIDEHQLTDSGIKDRVIKPFESSKFIQKCTSLLEQGSKTTTTSTQNKQTGDDWKINAPEMPQVEQKSKEKDNSDKNDALSSEIKGWGMDTSSQKKKIPHQKNQNLHPAL